MAASGVARAPHLKSLERSVYAHIQAVRALGRTSIVTTEIAHALKLSVAEVESTLDALQKKGVKIA